MLIIPAIDIYGGKCVRLQKGKYESARVYRDDPVDTARAFADLGARWIHVVDLNAARADGDNRAVIRELVRAVDCRVEVGGGIRRGEDVSGLAECGVGRAIVGTALVREPAAVAAWVSRYDLTICAAIDADRGRVKVSGWEEDGALDDTELARRAADMGMEGIVYTSIHRDGMLSGPDIARTNAVAEAVDVPVILSGGIGCADDLRAVSLQRAAGVVGVITGKAVYEASIDLAPLFTEHQLPGDAEAW